ncbi:hypothetical protein [Paraburkholderia sp. BL25I1N1]|uniref:hypothetical protein n=1 Tax=Paraburkholderia sp. BL25I1N1 TaxID=1938804 RepID=UPI000D04C5DD|nr:hypothetical protein [Paraburkholderia sp. BL25I1N1]PRX98248.1 hypothetical protein B0G73_12659 [Paraburkholderia sp. BL25I1N1]
MQKQIIFVTGAATGVGNLSAQSLTETGHIVYATMREFAKAQGIQLHPLELGMFSQRAFGRRPAYTAFGLRSTNPS